MNKYLGWALASTISLAAMGQAAAADLAARPYAKAPPSVAAAYNWTGFYLGVNGGYGWGRSTSAPSFSNDLSGGLAGGQIGYNWQVQNWVFGLEADGDWANIRGTVSCPNPAFNCSANTRALASFRGRVGWAFGPTLLYGTGGLGFTSTRYSGLAVATGLPSPGTTGYFTNDHWGWTAGVGAEYGFTPNLSAKLEYMHHGIGEGTAPAGTLSVLPSTGNLRVDTVKAGLNYRFGGPIVARY